MKTIEKTETPRSNFGMTLEQAQTITNKEGVLYTALETHKLVYIANNAKAPADKRMAATIYLQTAIRMQRQNELPKDHHRWQRGQRR